MGVIAEIAAMLLSLAIGGVSSSDIARKLLDNLFGRKQTNKTYSEKLTELTSSLTKSSEEVDKILLELAEVSKGREESLRKLEGDLATLEQREQETKKRIEDLQNIPLPVAERFAELTAAGEKRSAMRDYILFGAGVVVSTIIAIILKVIGLG